MKIIQPIIGLILILTVTLGSTNKNNLPSIAELKFLQRFGYLDPPAANSEALYKHDAVIEAIKTMQRYGAVPVTGKMDNATKALLRSRRCGVPDIIKLHKIYSNHTRNRRFVIASEGWKKRQLTYFLSNWSPKLGSRETVLKELKRAFQPWSDYSQLTFTHIDSSNADIIVSFVNYEHGDGYSFDGMGGTLAHAFFPYDYDAFGGDVHFDNDENWIIGPGDGTDFFTVAVHELGHSLGLGHSTDPESIMFPYYQGYNPYFTLGYDDILAMYQLYVVARFEEDKLTIQTTTKAPRKTTTTTTTTKIPRKTTTTTTTTPKYDIEVDDEGIINERTTKKHYDGRTTKHSRSTTTPSPPKPPPKPDPIPDLCDGSYDTISMIRGELFVFRDQYLWRFQERKRIEYGSPMKFQEMFNFPKPINHIDAAFEDRQGYLYFFSGRQIYTYDGDQFVDRWPRSLTDLNIRASVPRLDAGIIWPKNDKTYLFSGSEFWRYDRTFKMDPGYPKKMNRWRGVPYPIDSAFRWKDGNTYFFVGPNFYRFNDKRVNVEEGPLSVTEYWFNCSMITNSISQSKTKRRNRSHRHSSHRRSG